MLVDLLKNVLVNRQIVNIFILLFEYYILVYFLVSVMNDTLRHLLLNIFF